MLELISILLSLCIVALGVYEGRRWFGAYAAATERLNLFGQKLAVCSEGISFMEVSQGWLKDSESATRSLARSLLRHFEKEPIQLNQRLGWVLDIDELCDGRRHFNAHPAAVRVNSMPGMLMGAGILFTFLGLAVGVYGLDPTNADQLTLGVQRLLGGMSMAFLTSIAGIGTGLWWTWRSRQVAAGFEAAYTEIGNILHEKTFILDPEEINYQFIQDMSRQASAMQDLEFSVQRGVKKALDESFALQFKTLIDQFSTNDDVNKNIGKALLDIHKELKTISQHFADQAEGQRLIGKAVKRLLQQKNELSSNAVANAVNGQGQGAFIADALKLANKFQNVGQSQDVAIQSINEAAEQLKKMMQTARVANADIIKIHKIMVKQLSQLEAYWEDYSTQIKSLQGGLQETLSGFQGELNDSLVNVHNQFDELLAKGINHFAGALQDFQNTLTSFSTVMRDEKTKAEKSGGLFGRGK